MSDINQSINYQLDNKTISTKGCKSQVRRYSIVQFISALYYDNWFNSSWSSIKTLISTVDSGFLVLIKETTAHSPAVYG